MAEAVGVAASVLTLVGASLKSTKFIYEVVSSIKDAPTRIRRLADAVHELQLILQKLQSCRALSASNSANTGNLKSSISRCKRDVDRYAAELEKRVDSSGRPLVDFKTKIKVSMQDKYLQSMEIVLQGHIQSLTLHLNLLQSDQIFEQGDKIKSLTGSMAQLSTSSTLLSQSFRTHENYLVDTQGAVRRLYEDYLVNCKTTAATLHSAQKTGDAIVELVSTESSRHTEQVNDFRAEMRAELASLKSQMDAITCAKSAAISDNDVLSGTQPSISATEIETEKSIERLSRLVNEEACIFTEEQMEEIIDDLETLLRASEWAEPPKTKAKIPHQSEVGPRAKSPRDLKQIMGIFNGAGSLALNGELETQRPQTAEVVISNTWAMEQYELNSGVMTIHKHKRRRQKKHQDRMPETFELIAKIRFLPNRDAGQVMLAASAYRRTSHFSTNLTVTLMACPILPWGSLVFTLVIQRRFEEFKRLLQEGKASIRDHDEDGWSLLHYAANHRIPELCQFLIEHGADIDEISCGNRNRQGKRWISEIHTPLTLLMSGSGEMSSRILCSRKLLEHGADPTLGAITGSTGVEILGGCNVDFLKSAFDSGNCFLGLEQFLSILSGGRCSPEEVEFLLARGANIRDRDESDNNCLHIVLLKWRGYIEPWINILKVIILLIEAGADIHAKNAGGHTPSDIACYKRKDYGSAFGDVWDRALHETRHDISGFRKGHSGEAAYTNYYKRRDFENFWKGKEEECPYFHGEDELHPENFYEDRYQDYWGVALPRRRRRTRA
ncbi:hypothetical protein BCR34DRAFT_613130 [Clohesyomyces aquaticus]|uniref:Azaphilone pigments biosynthesis cluster protein L N-terminal domain-containing protein n=1 Tax=Clohesyomyces aquaticus TaxID=1231657 RepID=A0A1Y1ZU92_9PLEO|nr:hypothetical protein BCR34DRAFT_613130 [Clohesyomyces aquaticus]